MALRGPDQDAQHARMVEGSTRGRQAPRLLVVSGDRDRRERWARALGADGYSVARCAGPSVTCAILEGMRCPLLDEADVALYDRESFAPLACRLRGRHAYRATVVVAHGETRGLPSAIRRA